MKYSTDGRAHWTLISIRNRFSLRGDEYDVKYLRRCQQIRIYNHEKVGWRASIQSGSTLFSTPIAARTRSRTCRDVTLCAFPIVMLVCYSLFISVYFPAILLNCKSSLSAKHPVIYFITITFLTINLGCKAHNNNNNNNNNVTITMTSQAVFRLSLQLAGVDALMAALYGTTP